MAIKPKSKDGEAMSEEREVNGEDVATTEDNGWLTFTLHSTHDDFDIVVRVLKAGFEGCAPESIFRMAQTKYTHIVGQEASSATLNRDKDKFPNADAFMRTWRLNKRQAIVSGEYAEGTRGGPRGPRISDEEKELNALVISGYLMPRWLKAGNPEKAFPKNAKGLINDKPLDFWLDLVISKHPELKEQAKRNVEAAKAALAQAQAALASTADAFADLAA